MAIDVHCHVLPGVDDGPERLAEAIAMARQAEDDGTSIVCATPHIRDDHDVPIPELAQLVAELDAEVARRGIRVRIARGGEVAEERALSLTAGELRQVSFGGAGRWILLEPRPGPLGDELPRVVDELWARGLRCVVAHPERHAAHDVAERLAALVDAGVLVQVTAALLAHPGAGPTLAALAERGLVHLLGSDAHHPEIGRETRLSPGLAALREVELVRPHLEWIAETAPRALLAGEDVASPWPVG